MEKLTKKKKPYTIYDVRQSTVAKTKKCMHCESRYNVDKMLFLFTDPRNNKEHWICEKCNVQFNLKPI